MLIIICSSPVLAASPSVIVTDTKVTPSILMPEDLGMITVTLKNTAKSATITEEDVHEPIQSVKSTTETTSIEINPVIKSVYLDGKGDIKVLAGNSEYTGELGPEQVVLEGQEVDHLAAGLTDDVHGHHLPGRNPANVPPAGDAADLQWNRADHAAG